MSVDVLNTIEEWFTQSGDGGEFWQYEPADAFTVVGPSSERADMIYVYSTKPHGVTAAKREHREFDGLGFIGGYGMPCRAPLACCQCEVPEEAVYGLGRNRSVGKVACWR